MWGKQGTISFRELEDLIEELEQQKKELMEYAKEDTKYQEDLKRLKKKEKELVAKQEKAQKEVGTGTVLLVSLLLLENITLAFLQKQLFS